MVNREEMTRLMEEELVVPSSIPNLYYDILEKIERGEGLPSGAKINEFYETLKDIPKEVKGIENETKAKCEEIKEEVHLEKIRYKNEVLDLKSPMRVGKRLVDEGWVLCYDDLDIHVVAPTLDECKEDLQEVFYLLYEIYAKEKDENLAEGARLLKRRILGMIK